MLKPPRRLEKRIKIGLLQLIMEIVLLTSAIELPKVSTPKVFGVGKNEKTILRIMIKIFNR